MCKCVEVCGELRAPVVPSCLCVARDFFVKFMVGV